MYQMYRVQSLQSEAKELSDLDLMLMDSFSEWKKMTADIAEYSKDVKKDLGNFKDCIISIRDAGNQLSALHKAIIEIDSNVPEDCEPTYEELCAHVDDVYKKQLDNIDHDPVVEGIIDSVDAFIAQSEQAVENEDSSEILVVACTESYKDPLTKQLIRNPVRSQVCGHSYELHTILNYLQKQQRCPHSGCVKLLRSNDLVEDLELKRKLRDLSLNQVQEGHSTASEIDTDS